MERASRDSGSSRLLPEGALPCVWMTGGLVSYKLCDRGYECEGCPFDAALTGSEPAGGQERPERGDGQAGELRSDRRYGTSHGWLLALGGARMRFGIDAFAARLVGGLSGVVLPSPRSRLRRDRPACWLMDGADLVPLRAPVSGTVRRVNAAVQQNPGLVTDSPYDAGWLLEIECDDVLDGQPGLASAEQQGHRTARDIERVHRAGARRAAAAEVGPTLADGGTPTGDLRSLLGRARYLRLLRGLLG